MIKKTVYTPLGSLILNEFNGGISDLNWHHEHHHNSTPVLDEAAAQINAYLAHELQTFNVPIQFRAGTKFQKKVWHAISEIPFGQTATYGEIAKEVGSSPRAVGTACGKNPIPILIPCHRVVGASGKLTGYSGGDGVLTKSSLLAFEKSAKNKVPMFSLWDAFRVNIPHRPFYFMRHGETDYNKNKILQGGKINTSLNEAGRQQAIKAGQALNGKIDIGDIWHSTLKRTHETSEHFLAQFPHKEWRKEKTQHLNERELGLLEGEHESNLPPLYHIYQCSPEGETWLRVVSRLSKALEEILSQQSEKPPLIVAHGAVARCLGELLGCWPIETRFNNCEVWYVTPADKNKPWRAEQIHAGGL